MRKMLVFVFLMLACDVPPCWGAQTLDTDKPLSTEEQKIIHELPERLKHEFAMQFILNFVKGAKYGMDKIKAGKAPTNAEVIKAAQDALNESAEMLGWVKK